MVLNKLTCIVTQVEVLFLNAEAKRSTYLVAGTIARSLFSLTETENWLDLV